MQQQTEWNEDMIDEIPELEATLIHLQDSRGPLKPKDSSRMRSDRAKSTSSKKERALSKDSKESKEANTTQSSVVEPTPPSSEHNEAALVSSSRKPSTMQSKNRKRGKALVQEKQPETPESKKKELKKIQSKVRKKGNHQEIINSLLVFHPRVHFINLILLCLY
jgi:hypothetical protein